VFSWQYPLIELVTGLVFVFLFLRYSLGWFLPVEFMNEMVWLFLLRDVVLFVFLLIIFVYDLKYLLVLDRFSIPAMIVVLVMNLFLGVSPASMLIGLIVVAGFFAIQYFVSKGRWVGGGDIRIGAIIGLALGFEKGLLVLFLAYVVGAIVSSILLGLKRAGLKSQISFGPFLTAATFFVLIFGDWIINWYLTISKFV